MVHPTVWPTECSDWDVMLTDGNISAMSRRLTTDASFKLCPHPTSLFTGRERPVQSAADFLLGNATKRKVFVVHGLGGAGKTQLALRIVEQTREHWSDVVYADATSVETIETTLKAFADLKGIGNTYKISLQWLEFKQERWLLVLDNADDPSVNMLKYIPVNSQGSILITTRNQELLLLAQEPGSTCKISSMEPEEALQLLVKASRLEDTKFAPDEVNAAKALLEVCSTKPATVSMVIIVPRILATYPLRLFKWVDTSAGRSVASLGITNSISSNPRR